MAEELRSHHITALALSPGFLRSEQMLDHFGVDEEHWRDAVKQEPHYIESETPYFVGQAVASLAADPQVSLKSGQALTSWDLSDEYGFSDVDGRRPHWGRYAIKHGLTIN
ncbi:short chain dehydrogenase [compost metagenome]